MDKRKAAKRHGRRLQVSFRKPGEEETRRAYTTNISMTGLFVATNAPLPRGSRVRVEIHTESGFVAEGVVVHAARVPTALQSVRASGMGIRFLQIDELVHPLLPKGAASAAATAGDERDAPSAAAKSAYPPPEPQPDVIAEPAEKGRFPVHFKNLEELLRITESELRFGGVFVRSAEPAPLNSWIDVDLHLPHPIDRTLSAEGIVVRQVGAQSERGKGMEVALREPRSLLEELEPLLAPFADD